MKKRDKGESIRRYAAYESALGTKGGGWCETAALVQRTVWTPAGEDDVTLRKISHIVQREVAQSLQYDGRDL